MLEQLIQIGIDLGNDGIIDAAVGEHGGDGYDRILIESLFVLDALESDLLLMAP